MTLSITSVAPGMDTSHRFLYLKLIHSLMHINSGRKEEFIDITDKVAEHARGEGMLLVYCPHTTAGLTINEGHDPDVRTDILNALERSVPELNFGHSEGNSPAHIKATIVGSSVLVPVKEGKLQLGTWQRIFFCEFDGPRERMVIVQRL